MHGTPALPGMMFAYFEANCLRLTPPQNENATSTTPLPTT
jgi:hypothetical protein